MIKVMKRSVDITTTPAQKDDSEIFLERVNEFIKYSKNSNNDNIMYFQQHKVNDSMTGRELCQLLNHLKSDKGSDERNREFNIDGIGQYMLSDDGEMLQNLIQVSDHDHDGTTWTYITFEYLHADDLAKLAVKMYPDNKIQLEMDFFMSVCKGNQWQVGHIGVSDRDHKYWILCVIISKSENHESAGILLKRAIELLQNAGGDGRYVLVDGGKALDKAIVKENAERVDNVLENIRDGGDMLFKLNETNTQNAKTSELNGTVCESQTESVNQVCDEIVEAFIGQSNDDEGDAQGRKDLEERLQKLLQSHKLELMRCLAHVTRNAGSRGGGWRGGKGSLCRALLNGGCKKGKMHQVRDSICSLCITQPIETSL